MGNGIEYVIIASIQVGELVMTRFLAVDFYCGARGTTRGLLDSVSYVITDVGKDVAYLPPAITQDAVRKRFEAIQAFLSKKYG